MLPFVRGIFQPLSTNAVSTIFLGILVCQWRDTGVFESLVEDVQVILRNSNLEGFYDPCRFRRQRRIRF